MKKKLTKDKMNALVIDEAKKLKKNASKEELKELNIDCLS